MRHANRVPVPRVRVLILGASSVRRYLHDDHNPHLRPNSTDGLEQRSAVSFGLVPHLPFPPRSFYLLDGALAVGQDQDPFRSHGLRAGSMRVHSGVELEGAPQTRSIAPGGEAGASDEL